MMRRFLIAAALVLAPVAASAALPPPYTANYEVRRNGEALGTATVTFKALPNGRYELKSSTVGSQGLAAIAGVSVDERSIIRLAGGQPETVAAVSIGSRSSGRFARSLSRPSSPRSFASFWRFRTGT